MVIDIWIMVKVLTGVLMELVIFLVEISQIFKDTVLATVSYAFIYTILAALVMQ